MENGDVERPSEVQSVDARVVFDGYGANVPAQRPVTLKRKFATVSVSILASCVLFLDVSLPSTRPESVRKLADNSTQTSTDVDRCTWLYYNTDDAELMIGTFELRRSFIR